MFDDLLQMDVAELRDLLGMLSEESHAGHGVHEPEALVGLIEEKLRGLLGTHGADEPLDRPSLERRVIALVAEALALELEATDPPGRQLDRLYEHISERVVAELTPLFRVAVSMGWADGDFTEDEMLVVSSGLRRVRLQAAHRDALRKLTEAGKPSAAEAVAGMENVAQSPDRRRAMLAFAWAVALADGREDPGEHTLYEQLAANLGVEPDAASRLRELVTARYREALAAVQSPEGDAPERSATAALGALIASGLEEYLVSATGVIGLSLIMGVPLSLSGTASMTALPRSRAPDEAVGAPGLLAGSLLVRGLRKKPALQKSLALILACLDRRA